MSVTLSPLTSFSCLRFSGKDVAQFLQGQLSCDIHSVTEQQLSLTAYCNDKGRISASGYLVYFDQTYYLITPKNLVAHTIQKFKQYGIFSNIQIHLCNDTHILACIGKPAGVTPPESNNMVSSPEAGVYISCLSAEHQLFLCFGQQTPMIAFQEKLSAQKGHQLVLDMHIWEAANIQSGMVHIYPETLEKLTPHMVNYHNSNAVSFTKGCFLGQEVVARTQHRGRSKRKLYRCTIQNSTPIRLGMEIITKKEEPAGIVVAISEVQANTTQALVVLADHTIKTALYIQQTVLENITLAQEAAPQLALAD